MSLLIGTALLLAFGPAGTAPQPPDIAGLIQQLRSKRFRERGREPFPLPPPKLTPRSEEPARRRRRTPQRRSPGHWGCDGTRRGMAAR
jgi:hypothetical protein